jgi:hydroxymethylbilane synthase
VLAQWQTQWVIQELKRFWPDLDCQVLAIKTTGDKILDVSLSKIGDKGLFTKELEVYLQEGQIDLAVHSLKDLPTQLPEGCILGAICQREEPGDVLISRTGKSLKELPVGARLGTSSLRRKAQILNCRPDLQIEDLRGNVLTRLKKLEQQNLDAIILAAAGMQRLGLRDKITEYIPYAICLPAVGQGALAIEIRDGDQEVMQKIQPLHDHASAAATLAERALLRRLEGGCQIPIAALARIYQDQLILDARVASLDGVQIVQGSHQIVCPMPIESIDKVNNKVGKPAVGISWPYQNAAEQLGRILAEDLLARGAKDILQRICQMTR